MIPIHPTSGPDERTVRWKMPAGTLAVVGTAGSVPPALSAMYADGAVTRVVIGHDHLDVTLAERCTWRAEGARVRSAILAALEEPQLWKCAPTDPAAGSAAASAVSDDAEAADSRLYEAAVGALDGEVGELARSHGGAIELVSVRDGVLTVRMEGACRGCPAADLTLHARLERHLREACPELRAVRAAGARRGRDRSQARIH